MINKSIDKNEKRLSTVLVFLSISWVLYDLYLSVLKYKYLNTSSQYSIDLGPFQIIGGAICLTTTLVG